MQSCFNFAPEVNGLRRPENYNTKQGEALLAYLASMKDAFVTAAQIADHLQREKVAISKPTIYRRLEKLVSEGKVEKYAFGDVAAACFKYRDPNAGEQDAYHLKCENCGGVYDLTCDEVNHVSRHIYESHSFQVNDKKIVFYGKCAWCRKGVL